MKTLKTLFTVLFLVTGVAIFAQSKSVNVEKSTIKWVGEKVAGAHEGEIKFKSGSLELDGDKVIGGTFDVDMTTITCTDLTDAEWNGKLVGHLKSDDFFSVAKSPVSTLVIDKGGVLSTEATELSGLLTIKGITHPIKFKAMKDGAAFVAKVDVDRTLYNIKYGSGKFFDNLGDKMIKDIFKLDIKVVVE